MGKTYFSKKDLLRRKALYEGSRQRVITEHGLSGREASLSTLGLQEDLMGAARHGLSRHPDGTKAEGMRKDYTGQRVHFSRRRFGVAEEKSSRMRILRRSVKHSARQRGKRELLSTIDFPDIGDNLLRYDPGTGAEAFTTRRDSLLPYPVIQGHQVHGTKVAVIDRPDMTREDLEGYDAFICALPGVAIGVRTADCVPVLLHDPVRHVVAAVHSGWKGTVLKIAMEAISLMKREFGCQPGDLRAIIGPAIGPDSFQVGEEVVEKFRDAGFPMEMIHSFRGPGDGSPMSGGHHIDLFLANKWILEECGIRSSNISIYDIDTYTDPSFFSARWESTACGRNINAIRLIP